MTKSRPYPVSRLIPAWLQRLDLISDMAAIAEHHGDRLHRAGVFTEAEWAEHQRISYVALMVLGMDGMRRLSRMCLLEGAAELV